MPMKNHPILHRHFSCHHPDQTKPLIGTFVGGFFKDGELRLRLVAIRFSVGFRITPPKLLPFPARQ